VSSKKLRQAVFQALTSARTAATAQRIIIELGELNPHKDVKNEAKKVSEAAYAAAAHAWMAMIAMASDNLEVAQNAAQAAFNARDEILFASRYAFLFNREEAQTQTQSVPDEQELMCLWHEFCRSVSHEFPIPDNFSEGISR
jgi:hypothetical protein